MKRCVVQDSGATLEHNASMLDFRSWAQTVYLFDTYLNDTANRTLDEMVSLYGNASLDGRPPPTFPPSWPPAGKKNACF